MIDNAQRAKLDHDLFSAPEKLGPAEVQSATTAWALAVADEIGKDKNVPLFSDVPDAKRLAALKPYMDRVNEKLPPAMAAVAFNALAEAVEAQFALTQHLHLAVKENTSKAMGAALFEDKNYPEQEWIGDVPALIEYLKQPLSDRTMNEFLDRQMNFPEKKAKDFYQSFWMLSNEKRAEFLGALVSMPASQNDKEYGPAMQEVEDLLYPLPVKESAKTETDDGLGFSQHEAWDAPFEDDVWKEELAALSGETPKVKKTKINGLLRDFLPKDDTSKGLSSAHQLGLTFMEGFMHSSPPPHLIMRAVASMMDAIRDDLQDQASLKPRTLDVDERFGYRLGTFMGNLGPGATKVAQFGHSLPKSPDAWMPGLSTSKHSATRPTRYEYLNWVKDSVRPEMQKNIQHIGAHKGTGSYLSTYGAELSQAYVNSAPHYKRYRERYAGQELVLSVKKPKAREDALEFMEHLLACGEKMLTLNSEAAKSVPPLLDLVRQSVHMVKVETDLNHSKRQEDLAAQIYETLKVDAGSHLTDYYTQGAFDFGDDFRVSLCVDGEHFNALPENTASEKSIKRRMAISIFASELYVMLSGQAFDHDRHGDNQGITVTGKKSNVGIFDTGALMLNAPTKEQKEMFADCLMNAFANSTRNKYNVLSSLKYTVGKMSDHLSSDRKHDLDYINSVMRAAISLGDYFKHMKPADFGRAFFGVMATGDIDPVILGRMLQRLGAMHKVNPELASSLPAVGMITSVLSKLPAALMPRWEEKEDAVTFEERMQRDYYPHNPNSIARVQKEKTAGEQYEPVHVKIKNELGRQGGFASKAISGIIGKALRFK